MERLLVLERLVDHIGAQYYDHDFSSTTWDWITNYTKDSRAHTILSWFETVFRRYWEEQAKPYTIDTPIDKDYKVDWDKFVEAVKDAVKNKTPFKGICPVLHISIAFKDNECWIDDIGIRPCAIEHSFYRKILSIIAENLDANYTLKLQTVGIRKHFAAKIIQELGNQYVEEDHGTTSTKPYIFKHDIPVTTYNFKNLEVLKNQQILQQWNPPTAEELNNLSTKKTERKAMLDKMLKEAGAFATVYFFGSSNTSTDIPEPLQLDENDLKRFKNGNVP